MKHPEAAAHVVRERRAWFLIVMTLFVPGSAQIVAGKKKLGRWGLRVFIGFWVLVVLAVIVSVVHRSLLYGIVTRAWVLMLLAVVLIALAVFWFVLFFNTLQLIRPGLLRPRIRAATAGVIAVFMVLTSGGLAYGASNVLAGRGALSSVFGTGGSADAVNGRYNILLMGGDAGPHRIGTRPDSLSLVSIDADTGRAVIFGIPRNLENAPFPESSPMHKLYPDGYNCGDVCLINAIYQEAMKHKDLYPGVKDPGAQAMKETVSAVTGLHVQYYALIDLKGFKQLINAVGGIDIINKERIPISNSVYPGTDKHKPPKGWINPGHLHLDGYHALWYARSREFHTDYDRMVRQRCVQKAMLTQLNPSNVLTHFQKIAGAAPNVISTDIPQSQLGDFVSLALKTRKLKVGEAAFTPPQITPAYADYDKIHSIVDKTLAKSEAKDDKGPLAGKSDESGKSGSNGSDSGDSGKSGSSSDSEGSSSSGSSEAEPKESDICIPGK